MKTVEFTIFGEPMAKQRPRVTSFGGYAHAYTPKKTENFETLIRNEYRQQVGDVYFEDKLLIVAVEAYFSIPSSYSKKKKEKCLEDKYCPNHKDADNILKIVCDSLNQFAYKDDKYIVQMKCDKLWTADKPRLEVTIKEVGDD